MKKIIQGKKKILGALIVFALCVNSITAFAAPRKEAAWPQFRGETLNPGTTDSKTPRSADEIKEEWNSKASSYSYSDPIIVGKYVYVADSQQIKKLDRNTGEVLLIGQLAERVGFFSRMAYGEGKLFVPVGDGRVQCLNAETLESLWISEIDTSKQGLQAISPVLYYDGYVYVGASNGSATEGMFYALSAEDEDISSTNEIKEFTWAHEPATGNKGYYWSGGVIASDSVIFGGEAGEVVSRSLKDDKVIDTLEINEAIRSSIHYDRNIGRIYITTKAGNVHSIKVNPDGTFNDSSLLTTKIGADITSSPVTYNGRLYVAGGGVMSSAGFSVLDANTLEIIYQINNIASQSSPILTTAYATAENNYTVYMYAFNYNNPDTMYVIKDFAGNTEPIIDILGTPSSPQYNSSSAAVDEEGSIYFKNDSGRLYKFINTANGVFGKDDVIEVIERLPSIEDITLNDEVRIKDAFERYKDLSEEDKAKVTNIDKLEAALQKIEDLKNADKEVERIISEIDKLSDNITLENKEKINELYNSYSRLSDEHKAKVTNADKLINAKNVIDNLEEVELIKNIIGKIEALPNIKDIVLDKEELVNSLYKEFTNLTEEQKAKVTNADKLIEAKKKIDNTRDEVNSIEKEIWDKINPSKITLEDKEIVESLIARYEALDSRDRVYVKYFDEVLEAKKIIDKLEVENDKVDSGNKPESNKPGTTTKPGTTKPGTTTKPSNKLPQTGGVNNSIVIAVAAILVIGGAFLFMRKKEDKK